MGTESGLSIKPSKNVLITSTKYKLFNSSYMEQLLSQVSDLLLKAREGRRQIHLLKSENQTELPRESQESCFRVKCSFTQKRLMQ